MTRRRACRTTPIAAPVQQALIVLNPDKDATEIGDLYRKTRISLIESVRFAIECGQRLKAKQDALPHGAWLPWLRDNAEVLGFESRQTASRLMKLAANGTLTHHLDEAAALTYSRQLWGNDDDDVDDVDDVDDDSNKPDDDVDLDSLLRDDQGQLTPKARQFIREAIEADDVPDLLKPHVRGTDGTGEFERYTPQHYIDAAREVLGQIDLDPATCRQAQMIVKAAAIYTARTNGLDKPWHGRVFLNPPYHRELQPAFIDKLIAEIDAGRVTAAVVLTNNGTDTEWFDVAVRGAASVCFTNGRIGFHVPEGPDVKPTQGQAFFYYGDDPQRFEDVFHTIGFCMRLSRAHRRNESADDACRNTANEAAE